MGIYSDMFDFDTDAPVQDHAAEQAEKARVWQSEMVQALVRRIESASPETDDIRLEWRRGRLTIWLVAGSFQAKPPVFTFSQDDSRKYLAVWQRDKHAAAVAQIWAEMGEFIKAEWLAAIV